MRKVEKSKNVSEKKPPLLKSRTSGIRNKTVPLPAVALLLAVPFFKLEIFRNRISDIDIGQVLANQDFSKAELLSELFQDAVYAGCEIAARHTFALKFTKITKEYDLLVWMFVVLKTFLAMSWGKHLDDRRMNTMATEATFSLAQRFPTLNARIALEEKNGTLKKFTQQVRDGGVEKYKTGEKSRRKYEADASELWSFFESLFFQDDSRRDKILSQVRQK